MGRQCIRFLELWRNTVDPDLRRDDGVFVFPQTEGSQQLTLTTILLLNIWVFFTKFISYEKRII